MTEQSSQASGRFGKETRKRVSRSGQADWAAGPERTDPVDILAAQDETRVAALIPVRYGRMLASAFTFYRGAAAIMAADLGSGSDSGLRVQLCGDAHLSNFGLFQAPDRRLVFDINDFDETLPGPFEWDVKRLAASVEIAGRDRGFKSRERRTAVLSAVGEYRRAMRKFAGMNELDVWYSRLDVSNLEELWQAKVTKADRRALRKKTKKARGKDSLRALDRLTEVSDGELRIASRPPLLVPIDELAASEGQDPEEIRSMIGGLFEEYRTTLDSPIQNLLGRYRYQDAAHKVVGVGSVGNRAWIALFLGRDEKDPLFLQMKEATSSVLEPYAGSSKFRKHGRRVVAGQRLMQAAGDIFLGWVTFRGIDGIERDFYIRQLWDGKASAEVGTMRPDVLRGYAGLCGWSLARAHACSGDRFAIAAYLGKSDRFDQAIADFAADYANQNEADYVELLDAERDGRISVAREIKP